MNIPHVDPIWLGRKHLSIQGLCHPTYREIYEAISNRDDFKAPQLFYLNRLVARRLKTFAPRLDADDLDARPY